MAEVLTTIRVLITRESKDRIEEVDFEKYISTVVPSEMPTSADIEALMAQAIASRTFAYHKMLIRKNKDYDVQDNTNDQAYVPSKLNDKGILASDKTLGLVLTYKGKICDTCVYSASNGGMRIDSKKHGWNARDYLTYPDPYDGYTVRSGYTRKDGHGIGLSQRGAMQAAKEKVMCGDILRFYYPGTEITHINRL